MAVVFASSDCQNAVDNLGKVMVDTVAALPTSSTVTTISTDLGTEVTRIQSLTDTVTQPALLREWTKEQFTAANEGFSIGRLVAWLQGVSYAAALQYGPYACCDALEFICSQVGSNTGLANFLANNNVLVDQYTADLFNAFVTQSNSGGYIRKLSTTNVAKIPSTSVFPHANLDYIRQFTTTGAAAGTLIDGNNPVGTGLVALTGGNTAPGGGVVEAYASGSIGGSSYTLTATYTSIAGLVNQTCTFAIVGSATNGTVFTPTPNPGPTIAAITSVAVTGANTGDVIRFRLKPVRAITA